MNCQNPQCNKTIISKRPKKFCYTCFLTQKNNADYARRRMSVLKLRNDKRHNRLSFRKGRFECEMGYHDCKLRGFCNGDC